MLSKRNHEGYLLIDHRDSPGVSPELCIAMGLPPTAGMGKFECATFTCSHCETVINVVRAPNSTSELHPKGYCPHCDHYVCQKCEDARVNGAPCYPFKKMALDILEQLDKGKTEAEAIQSLILLKQ